MEFLLPLCSSFQCICLIARWEWEVQIGRTFSLALSLFFLSLFNLFVCVCVSVRSLDCALWFFPLCFSFSSLSLSCFVVVVCVFSPTLLLFSCNRYAPMNQRSGRVLLFGLFCYSETNHNNV